MEAVLDADDVETFGAVDTEALGTVDAEALSAVDAESFGLALLFFLLKIFLFPLEQSLLLAPVATIEVNTLSDAVFFFRLNSVRPVRPKVPIVATTV